MYTHYGKQYKTILFFDEDVCNEWLIKNPDYGVLAVVGRLIYVANINDKGI